MTTRARRSRAVETTAPASEGIVVEGAERYIWVFPEEEWIVLAIPGLRGLKFSADEARAVGEMLIQTAEEITQHQRIAEESGDDYGGPDACPVEG